MFLLAVAALSAAGSVSGQMVPPRCAAPTALVSLDHVVIGVADLDAASTAYRVMGFTLKDGRLHTNGLKNRHIKFDDGTELELMTVVGQPRDETAAAYSSFIEGGAGGVYLALHGSQDVVLEVAVKAGLEAAPISVGGFHYVTFREAGLARLFSVEYTRRSEDPKSVLTHSNGSKGLELVWMEGSGRLGVLLVALGARECGMAEIPDGRVGRRYGVAGGEIVVVERSGPRFEVIGVQLRAGRESAAMWEPAATHGIWIVNAPEFR